MVSKQKPEPEPKCPGSPASRGPGARAALSPYDLGRLAGEADIAAGRLPSREALDKAAAIIAASRARQAAEAASRRRGQGRGNTRQHPRPAD